MRDPGPGLGAAGRGGCVWPRLATAATAFAAARTSVSVTRPSGPVPFTLPRSTPSSAAIRRATGDAFTRASDSCSGGRAGRSGSALVSRDSDAGDTPASTSFCGGGGSVPRAKAGRGAPPRPAAPWELLPPAFPFLAAAAVRPALARLSSRETPRGATRPPLHLFAAAQFLFLLL